LSINKKNTDNGLKKKGLRKKSSKPSKTIDQIKQERSELRKRAIDLYQNNYMVTSIAKNLGVASTTVHKWLREAGVRKHTKFDPFAAVEPDPSAEVDPLAATLEEDLKHKTGEAVRLAKHDAVLEEDKSLLEIAESQSSPADKYQHYVAATGIKLMRDSMKNLRGPRTVRELSELDQLIRRNLGLNAKNGGGTSKMQIDISILNNTEADRGGGAVRIKKKPTIIDVTPEPQQDQNQEQDHGDA
jgi:transposase-like protein